MDSKNDVINIIESVCTSIKVGDDDHDKTLTDLGIDSLDLSGILLELEEKFSVKIQDEDISKLRTVNQIADFIARKGK